MSMIPSKEFRNKHPELDHLPDATVWSLEQSYANKTPEEGAAESGIYAKMFSGLEQDVERNLNLFYRNMQKMYKTFDIISTTSAQNRFGITVTITYRI